MNSYQKLKQENERLKKDIYTLVMNPDSVEGNLIMSMYGIEFRMYDAVSEVILRRVNRVE